MSHHAREDLVLPALEDHGGSSGCDGYMNRSSSMAGRGSGWRRGQSLCYTRHPQTKREARRNPYEPPHGSPSAAPLGQYARPQVVPRGWAAHARPLAPSARTPGGPRQQHKLPRPHAPRATHPQIVPRGGAAAHDARVGEVRVLERHEGQVAADPVADEQVQYVMTNMRISIAGRKQAAAPQLKRRTPANSKATADQQIAYLAASWT